MDTTPRDNAPEKLPKIPGAPVQPHRPLFRTFKRSKDQSPKFIPRLWGGLGLPKRDAAHEAGQAEAGPSVLPQDPPTPVYETNRSGRGDPPMPVYETNHSSREDPSRDGRTQASPSKTFPSTRVPGVPNADSPDYERSSPKYGQTPHEAPLERPQPSPNSDTPEEPPLRKPDISGAEIDFPHAVLSVAVDVSGSTKGPVLQEEKQAIQDICCLLSEGAKARATVIPWNQSVRPTIRCNELHKLTSGGGTEPSQLVSSAQISNTGLLNCSAWFLLTDGEIDNHEVTAFSRGIAANGLHGTTSVIILFGYKSGRPFNCNISVGLSVFSTAPDCLFIFHDIDSGRAYILQSKGIFNVLIPTGLSMPLLDQRTRWEDLPSFSYQSLHQLSIPAPQSLRADDIRLQSKKTVKLQDIYESRVDEATASEILENDDNLRTLLLTAQIRGHDSKVSNWISEQAIAPKDPLSCPRPDVSDASGTMRALLEAMEGEGSNTTALKQLRKTLRLAHAVNWSEFISNMKTERLHATRRKVILRDSKRRIAENREMMMPEVRGTYSPGMLSPVSPGSSPFGQKAGKQPAFRKDTDILYVPGYRSPHIGRFQSVCPICREVDSTLVLLLKRHPTEFSTQTFPQPGSRSGVTYPLAFGTYPETDILSSTICCDACAYTMIHARVSLDNEELLSAIPLIPEAFAFNQAPWRATFDSIDAAFQQRFQTSIVESVFLSVLYSTRSDILEEEREEEEIEEQGDKFEGLAQRDIRSRATEDQDDEFERRAQRDLGIEDHDDEFERRGRRDIRSLGIEIQDDEIERRIQRDVRSRALQWVCKRLAGQLHIPEMLCINSPLNSPASSRSSQSTLPMAVALRRSILDLSSPDSALLHYPIGGFVVLVIIMVDLGVQANSDSHNHGIAVWHRFLFHLAENFQRLRNTDGMATARELRSLLYKPDLTGDTGASKLGNLRLDDSGMMENGLGVATGSRGPRPSLKRLSVSVQDLLATRLLSEEDNEIFARLGSLYKDVLEDNMSALAVFLHHLSVNQFSGPFNTPKPAQVPSQSQGESESDRGQWGRTGILTPVDAMEVFEELRCKASIREIFDEPTEVREGDAAIMVSGIADLRVDV